MRNSEGTPIWYELMTNKPEASQISYSSVMGWKFEAMPGSPEMEYYLASYDDQTIAGVMPTPEHARNMPEM